MRTISIASSLICFMIGSATTWVVSKGGQSGYKNVEPSTVSEVAKPSVMPPSVDVRPIKADPAFICNIIFQDFNLSRSSEVSREIALMRWALIVFLTAGDVSDSTCSFGDVMRKKISSDFSRNEVENWSKGYLLSIKKSSFGLHGNFYDVDDRVIMITPGINPHVKKYIYSNRDIDVVAASSEFANAIFGTGS